MLATEQAPVQCTCRCPGERRRRAVRAFLVALAVADVAVVAQVFSRGQILDAAGVVLGLVLPH